MGLTKKVHHSVGSFIRKKRRAIGLSQRELSLRFQPEVSVQFISKIEKGLSPLPLSQVAILGRVLLIDQAELIALLTADFIKRLRSKITGLIPTASLADASDLSVKVQVCDFEFIFRLYQAYQMASLQDQRRFAEKAEKFFKVSLLDSLVN